MSKLRDAAQKALEALEKEPADYTDWIRAMKAARAALRAALAEQQEPVEATPYTLKRVAWELERTAVGDGFYGNALRVAKDMPGITMEDRSVLYRYETGTQTCTDHVHLQWLAQRLLAHEREALPDEELALNLLETLFDAYENGLPCYENPDGEDYVGVAIRLDDETFHACGKLLARRRPRASDIGGQP